MYSDRFLLEQQQAMKEGDKTRLSVLRLLRAAIKNREVEKGRPLEEAEVIQAITSACKQRKDAIPQYLQGGRVDLAEKEEAELKILEGFLPPQMSEEELAGKIEEAIVAAAAASLKDMGKVMAHLMPQVLGRMDGKIASEKVKEALLRIRQE
jgi:uncharacterized protein YqeY